MELRGSKFDPLYALSESSHVLMTCLVEGYCNESISMILTGDGWQASLHLSSLHGVASSGFVCISSISYISLYAWLVVYLPLWNIWKSVGMIIPNIWENRSHVPYHQPDAYWSYVNVGSLWMCYLSMWYTLLQPAENLASLAPSRLVLSHLVFCTLVLWRLGNHL